MGGTYREENGYLIPNLTLPEEEQVEIGIWGQRHLEYIKHHRNLKLIDQENATLFHQDNSLRF